MSSEWKGEIARRAGKENEKKRSNITHRRVRITKSNRKPYVRKYQENIN